MKLSGIKINRNAKGEATSITISIKQHAEWLEDFIDAEYVKAAKEKGIKTIPWEEAKAELTKSGPGKLPKKPK